MHTTPEEIYAFREKFKHMALSATSGNDDLSEDLASEIVLYAIERMDKYKPTEKLVNWVHRVAENYLKNKWKYLNSDKRKAVTVEWTVDLEHGVLADDEEDVNQQNHPVIHSVEEELVVNELVDGADAAIDRLPIAFRDVAILAIREGWKATRIAAYLDLPVNTVKTRLHRARTLIGEAVEREERINYRPIPAPLYNPEVPVRSRSEVKANAADLYGKPLAEQVYWKQPASLLGNPLLLDPPTPVVEVEVPIQVLKEGKVVDETKIVRRPYNLSEVPEEARFIAPVLDRGADYEHGPVTIIKVRG